ncbi:MAG TPA: GNAT family N-acetyltransferase [Puia sp.]|nr:GNAT family N-acetyltransferase [Puia sp.]
MDTPLDNPAWSALTTAQWSFAQGAHRAKRYKPNILPFAGLAAATTEAAEELDALMAPGEAFYIIGDLPPLPARWQPELELPCAQLLAPIDLHGLPQPQEAIVPLGEADKDDMYKLITSIQPGYYHPDTCQLGEYFGIRRKDQLIAMAGERLRLTGYTELSAICTHPDYTGHGYAQQLIAWLCRRQTAKGIIPFLHVALSNERALRLYIHLGFRHRREIVFHRIRVID